MSLALLGQAPRTTWDATAWEAQREPPRAESSLRSLRGCQSGVRAILWPQESPAFSNFIIFQPPVLNLRLSDPFF